MNDVVPSLTSAGSISRFVETRPTSSVADNAFTYEDSRPYYLRVACVIGVEMMLNILRPSGDPDWFLQDTWTMRLPIILWDGVMCTTALLASTRSQPPSVFILLAILLGTTAAADLCIWTPVFAFATEWETCACARQEPRCLIFCKCIEHVCSSNFRKGPLRLFVTLQSFLFGMCCLDAASTAWGTFTHLRDVTKAERMAAQIALAMKA